MVTHRIQNGDCRAELKTLADCSVHSVVTDPPYELGFMGKGWDRSGIAYDVEVWRECLRVLKPGGHLLAFGGSRTYHRLACAIEDAGFEIRDDIDFWYDANPVFAAFYDSLNGVQKELLHQSAGASHLSWLYGSGFPKSRDVGKDIEKIKVGGIQNLVQVGTRKGLNNENGTQGFSYSKEYVAGVSIGGKQINGDIPVYEITNEWNGWGTALKPAHEPIVLARKPLIGTVAENVLQHGTGGLNIDGCRINPGELVSGGGNGRATVPNGFGSGATKDEGSRPRVEPHDLGRWPANVIHDGSEEVLAAFPDSDGQQGDLTGHSKDRLSRGIFGDMKAARNALARNDSGSATRFFYCAKASQEDRNDGCEDLPFRVADTEHKRPRAEMDDPRRAGVTPRQNNHPTVKPTDLMRYLCRLITPPGGTVLDPFCGSGSTGRAAILEQLNFIGIELDAEYCVLAEKRIEAVTRQGMLMFA